MAVAVKNPPGASSASPLARPSLVGLLGAFYVFGSLALLFKGLPYLWEEIGMRANTLVGGSLLALVTVVAAVALLWVGGRLLTAPSPTGSRAGAFVGFVGLVLVLLLTRWASLWIEHWAFDANLFTPTVGAILTGVAAAAFLALMLYGYFQPWTQRQIVQLEEGGWFHATPYKSLQGLRVRRATILGIVIVVLAGIWTMISHGTLRRGPEDWSLNIPFTGRVAIESYGDTQEWVAGLPPEQKNRVQVLTPGDTHLTNLEPKEVVKAESFRQGVKAVLQQSTALAGKDIDPDGEITALLLSISRLLYEKCDLLLEEKFFTPEVVRNLREVEARATETNPTPLIEGVLQQAARADKLKDLDSAFSLPAGLLVVDRFTLRDINSRTDPKQFVRVKLVTDPDFTLKDISGNELKGGALEDHIVRTADFDAEVEQVKKDRRDFTPPETVPLAPATGPTQFATVTLLPSVQYTFPLLLLVLSGWLAWRVVNMPTFADFLIATEAEMNKVSWTTQRRLVQDTIVVLVTVVLMAAYLFGVDQIWRVSLSWKPIGVLVIPREQSDTNTSVEQKKW